MPTPTKHSPGRPRLPAGHPPPAHRLRGITRDSALKGHLAIDPDSEVILATAVTAGNAADAAAVAVLLAADLPAQPAETPATPELSETPETPATPETLEEPLTVYGDSAYGTGALLDGFEQAGVETRCKTQPPRAPGGRFPKSEFLIDLDAGTVTCPANHTVTLRTIKHG